MRRELEKLASREVELFEALRKKIPADVVVMQTGKNFPRLGFTSPFYAKGDDLRAILQKAGKLGKQLAKEVKSDKRYVVVPPPEKTLSIRSMGVDVSAPSYTYLAHEMGHAIEQGRGLSGRLLHGPVPTIAAAVSPMVGMLAGSAFGKHVSTPGAATALGALLGAGVAGLGQYPLLHRENQASDRAMALLREVGATPKETEDAERALGAAKSTYNRAALSDTAVSAIGSGLMSLLKHHSR
jgi:hypothetical protein